MTFFARYAQIPPVLTLTTLICASAGVAQNAPDMAAIAQADSLYEARSYSQANAAYQAAVRSAEQRGSTEMVLRGLLGLGTTTTLVGQPANSEPIFERALDLSRQSQDRRSQVKALQGLGIAHHDQAHHALALDAYAKALSLARELGDPAIEGPLWNNIASVRYRQGDYLGALQALERARTLTPANTSQYARVLTNIGRAHAYLGQYALAEILYEEARTLAERLDDVHLKGLVWNRFATLYERTGQNELAWEANLKSLEVTRATGLRQGTSATLDNLGILRKKAGDLTGALTYLLEANAIQRADKDDTGAGTTLKQIADVYRLQGNLTRARETYAEALAIDLRAGQRGQAGYSRLGLGEALLALGEKEGALAQADSALALAREVQYSELEIQATYRRSVALRALGRPEEALSSLAAATELIDRLRAGLTTDPSKISFLEERQAPFHEYVDLLIELGQPRTALEVAERARARAFVDLLAGRAALPEDERAALVPVEAAEAALREAISTPDSLGAVGPGSLLALRVAHDLEEAVATLAGTDEELASLISAQSVSGEEIEALARSERATIVEYLVAEENLYIWVVNPNGRVRAHVEPIGRSELRAAVERVRTTWQDGLAAGLGPQTTAGDDLADLHRRLIAPIAGWLPDDPDAVVYVVPHDVLFLLPFAALRDLEGGYLIERHTLAHAPSISVLAWLDKDGASEARGWLGVGNPVPPADSGLDRLPWAEREVRGVAERFPAELRHVLIGEEATETAMRELAPGRAIVHFAGHGVISDQEPLASALVLSPDARQDGFLRSSEIFELDLAADLVVLSGCSTALGRLTGDGILGLSRAFLYAGTPTVIVSQWDVSDRATAELMDRFYMEYANGLEPAHALRTAQRALLDRYPHPFLWAAFELIGRAR